MSLILGIYRETLYSPGHTENDALILRLVAEELRAAGHTVELLPSEAVATRWQDARLILSMCQGPAQVDTQTAWQRQGRWIINRPDAIARCYRTSLVKTLTEAHLPFPRHLVIKTGCCPNAVEEGLARLGGPEGLWVKRGDVHATQPEDVQRVRDPERLRRLLDQFQERGIATAVLQEHVVGDEVKFYGLTGGSASDYPGMTIGGNPQGGSCFFWWFYSRPHQGYPFSHTALQELADRAAQALGLEVYGGDAVVTPEGRLILIDVNDWPTFAPCRGAAAGAIGAYVKGQLHPLATQATHPKSR